jgi:hypothetical protein
VSTSQHESLQTQLWINRSLAFVVGTLVGVLMTLAVSRVLTARQRPSVVRAGYEGLPLADNSGVCQEYVALAALQTTYTDAVATARRLSTLVQPPLRAEHFRVVRALVPGEHWTIALDGQAGAGSLEVAQQHAVVLNSMAGTGLRWTARFYGARELYDSAGVLCMPRQSAGASR